MDKTVYGEDPPERIGDIDDCKEDTQKEQYDRNEYSFWKAQPVRVQTEEKTAEENQNRKARINIYLAPPR